MRAEINLNIAWSQGRYSSCYVYVNTSNTIKCFTWLLVCEGEFILQLHEPASVWKSHAWSKGNRTFTAVSVVSTLHGTAVSHICDWLSSVCLNRDWTNEHWPAVHLFYWLKKGLTIWMLLMWTVHGTGRRELYRPINKHPIWINKPSGQCCLEMPAINLRGPPSASLNYKGSASRETLTAKHRAGC